MVGNLVLEVIIHDLIVAVQIALGKSEVVVY